MKHKYFCTIFVVLLSLSPLTKSETGTPGTVLNDEVNGTVTDIDGNVYRTIKIGEQWWMAENLRVKHYRYGDTIPYLVDNTTWGSWAGLKIGACCSYNHDEANGKIYGLLYNWYAVNDSRSIAPEGWHVSTNADWKKLEIYLGMSQSEVERDVWRGLDEGGKLKETGTAHWQSPNCGATDEFNFCALPGGARFQDDFYAMGSYAYFWTSIIPSYSYPAYRSLFFRYADIFVYHVTATHGFSVRCVKD